MLSLGGPTLKKKKLFYFDGKLTIRMVAVIVLTLVIGETGDIYSWFLRHVTARGFCTSPVTVGPTKL